MKPGKYSSLEHYEVEDATVKYKGTFPYLDDGATDLSKTVLFTRRGIIHAEYSENQVFWSADFDLSPPPQKSYGYFTDETSKGCALYRDAVFQTSTYPRELIVLNKHDKDTAVLEKYAFAANTFTKTQSYPLKGYKNSAVVSLKLSSNKNEIIITGLDGSGN